MAGGIKPYLNDIGLAPLQDILIVFIVVLGSKGIVDIPNVLLERI